MIQYFYVADTHMRIDITLRHRFYFNQLTHKYISHSICLYNAHSEMFRNLCDIFREFYICALPSYINS